MAWSVGSGPAFESYFENVFSSCEALLDNYKEEGNQTLVAEEIKRASAFLEFRTKCRNINENLNRGDLSLLHLYAHLTVPSGEILEIYQYKWRDVCAYCSLNWNDEEVYWMVIEDSNSPYERILQEIIAIKQADILIRPAEPR